MGAPLAPPPPEAVASTSPAGIATGPVLAAFLVSYQSDPNGAHWVLKSGRLVVGRQGAADGLDVEINDPTTSSNHAAFHVDANTHAVQLEDLGSTNGTYVNDEAIPAHQRRELRDHDKVRFGGFTTVLVVVPRF